MFDNKFNQNADQQQNNQAQSNQKPSPGLFSLPPAVMNIVPWIPLMLEMTTGQKIPAMTGTLAEIQAGIQQIQMAQVQIIQHQTNLEQRLTSLETNAGQQFTNLANQVQGIKSVRMTHDRERKQIDYNLDQNQQN